jgi:hypothetical protein
MSTKRAKVLAVACLLLVACGDEAGRPALPEGFDVDAVAEGKADALTKWYTEIQGAATFDEAIAGKTNWWEWFHGYTFTLDAGDVVSVNVEASDWGVVGLYGPKKPSGSWSGARALEWIEPQDGTYGGTIGFTAAKSGSYLVIVGSPWAGSYDYTLTVGCVSGSCAAHCLEYETVDPDGNPLQNFYAINVASYDEGKQLLAPVSDAINAQINPGSCADQSQACGKIIAKPVCGDSPGEPKQTFASVCYFKIYIRTLAGTSGEAKGHWEDGPCEAPYCVIWQAADANGKPENAFYAVNVWSYQEGKDKLAQFATFVNEEILTGSCGSQLMACPKVYLPVCADTPTTAAQTYGNLCTFKAEVMKLAGDVGEHKGKWTDGACAACDPATEWYRQYKYTDLATCAVVKFYCQPYTVYFANSCGCGCEQDASCPEVIDCEPPPTQTCLDLQKKCPYSKVAL